MFADLLNWLFALTLGGLPLFSSDRFDLYFQGTNDTPVTFTIALKAEYEDGGVLYKFYLLSAPAGNLDMYVSGGFFAFTGGGVEWVTGDYFFAEYNSPVFLPIVRPGNGDDIPNLYGQYYYSPWGVSLYNSTTDAWHLFQAEWIEPSWTRCIEHAVLGGSVCFSLDFIMMLFWRVFGTIFRAFNAV